jgi:hypothetical protein
VYADLIAIYSGRRDELIETNLDAKLLLTEP